MSDHYKVGDRVQYVSGGSWKPIGAIKKISPAIYLDEKLISGEMCTIIWDETLEESGWISTKDIIRA